MIGSRVLIWCFTESSLVGFTLEKRKKEVGEEKNEDLLDIKLDGMLKDKLAEDISNMSDSFVDLGRACVDFIEDKNTNKPNQEKAEILKGIIQKSSRELAELLVRRDNSLNNAMIFTKFLQEKEKHLLSTKKEKMLMQISALVQKINKIGASIKGKGKGSEKIASVARFLKKAYKYFGTAKKPTKEDNKELSDSISSVKEIMENDGEEIFSSVKEEIKTVVDSTNEQIKENEIYEETNPLKEKEAPKISLESVKERLNEIKKVHKPRWARSKLKGKELEPKNQEQGKEAEEKTEKETEGEISMSGLS